jgi:hypothetical protein
VEKLDYLAFYCDFQETTTGKGSDTPTRKLNLDDTRADRPLDGIVGILVITVVVYGLIRKGDDVQQRKANGSVGVVASTWKAWFRFFTTTFSTGCLFTSRHTRFLDLYGPRLPSDHSTSPVPRQGAGAGPTFQGTGSIPD